MSTTADRFKRLGDVLRGEQDRTLGRRAVRAGFITEQELADYLGRGGSGPLDVEWLLRAKGVAEEEVRRLRSELDRDEYVLFRPDRRAPPEVLAVQEEPDRRLAEFILLSRLGQGGVGEVWKAWDTRLGRWVAIKLPRATPDHEAATRRFTREALAAARLSHPNIVSIYRVAEQDGRCFIVMQFIEGQTLGAARPAPRQALEILHEVALAVHHAHEQGVVHRDLKPGNILIDSDGRPFVLDFGLAHLEEAAGPHSREGLVAGTAAYMSPEQARGGPAARCRSTDVYSLGATLYEAATGRPPFDGASFAEILQKVLHEEPPAPQGVNPAVTRDVESVILKAMDKEPARRYATAQELADDLGRCLREEPVTAARRTVLRALRRSRRVALVLAAAGVLALAAGGLTAVRAAREARERESKVQAFRDVARVSLEAVLALRRGGLNDQMGAFWPRLESSYREALAVAPDQAELHWLVGRVHRALMDDARAREFQGRALAKDPEFAPAVYENLVLAAKAGRSELPRVGRFDVSRLSGPQASAARGILAFLGGDLERARESLRQALAADPGMEEAWEVLAATYTGSVTVTSAPASQEEAYERANVLLTEGLARDRGYAPLWAGRARVRAARASLLRETGHDPQQEFQAAEDDFAQALRLRPSAELHRARGVLRGYIGVHRMELGGNPIEDFAEAEADFKLALQLEPADALTLAERVALRCCRARYRVERGESPEEDVKAGALEVGKGGAKADLHHAALVGLRAMYGASVGEDPTEPFASSRRLFDEALRRRPDAPEILERRAFFRLERARVFSIAQRDVREDVASALTDAEKAVETTSFFNRARITRAAALRLSGLEERKAGRDPSTLFQRARADVDEVLELNPLSTDAWIQAGHLELDRGNYRMQASDRAGARDRFTQATRSYEEALRLNPFIPGRLREPLREARRALLATY